MLARLKNYQDRENGFTLIELLIVVLIIGIFAAIAIPVYLGVQANARHSAVKADTNNTVKLVQAALTEGALTIPAAADTTGISGYSDPAPRGDGATVTTTPTGAGQFQIRGVGADGYTYTYDSITGQFSENTSFGSGGGTAPLITTTTLPAATIGSAYTKLVTAAGTPASTFVATGLPAGLSISGTGAITGTPTAANTVKTYPVTITASNGTSPDATTTLNLVLNAFTPTIVYDTNTTGFSAYAGYGVTAYPTYMTIDVSSYGTASTGYTTVTGLSVGRTYAIAGNGGVSGGGWSGQNCSSIIYGSSTTATTSYTTAGSTFTATATSMRIYMGGASDGTGTLHCTISRTYLTQMN